LAIEEAIGSRVLEGSTLVNIGTIYANEDDAGDAIGFYQRALQISHAIGDRRSEAAVCYHLMVAWYSREQPRLAVFYGKLAVNLYQSLRADIAALATEVQHKYVQSIEGIYRTLAEILITQNRLAEAQQVVMLLKEEEYRRFVRGDVAEAVGSRGRATLTAEEGRWQQRYEDIAGRVAELGRQRGELERNMFRSPEEQAALAALDADLEIAGIAFQAFLDRLAAELGPTGVAKVYQIREAEGLKEDLHELGGGTVAIYTVIGSKSLSIILVTPDAEKAFSVPISAVDLARSVFALRQSLQDPDQDPRPAAMALYKVLVEPLAKDLQQVGARTLMWSLDGVLRYVPIAALYANGHYLVERYNNVVFTPASNARLKDRPAATWRGVGLGVSIAHEGFDTLPCVPDELHAIFGEGAMAGVLDGSVLLDDEFTAEALKTAVRSGDPVIHVASHFRFAPGDDTRSFLLLGDGTHLTVASLRAQTELFRGVELLTLSACDTAVGNQGDGAEVEAFSVLAQRSGAKAVMASLWSVDDESTRRLMEEFLSTTEQDNRGVEGGGLATGAVDAPLWLLRDRRW
jgi:CHAT domain-containing protein